VGLVGLARKGGSTKGGQRLPNLYRLTDRDCYEIPKLHLEALSATKDWKRISTVEQGKKLIQAAEDAVKKESAKLKNQGHTVTTIGTRPDAIKPIIRTSGDTWNDGLGHVVTIAENPSKPLSMRVADGFDPPAENATHRTPTRPPLYVATPTGETALQVTAPPTATIPAPTAVNGFDGGRLERVRDRDLDPALYDPTTGEYLTATTAPARQPKQSAKSWVKAALVDKAQQPFHAAN
jgi:hypothetical protein